MTTVKLFSAGLSGKLEIHYQFRLFFYLFLIEAIYKRTILSNSEIFWNTPSLELKP